MTFALITVFIASFILTYPVRYLAPKLGFMDIPSDARRMHTEPIPRLGGLAIFTSFTAVMFICRIYSVLPYALGGFIVVAIGLADDKHSLNPIQKLAGQTASAVALCCFGITIDRLSFLEFSFELGVFAYPITVLWVVIVTNAFNLIDGLDGLCCGISVISAYCIGLIALFSGMEKISVCAVIFAFACIGHIPHNAHPAKIFIGDTGAMLCGFILSALSIDVVFDNDSSIAVFVPIAIFGIPLFDAACAVFRRIGKQSVFMGDKEHIHHRLSRRYGHPRTVMLLYAVSTLLSVIAITMTSSEKSELIGVLLIILLTVYAVIRLDYCKF